MEIRVPASSVSRSLRYKLRQRVVVPVRKATSALRATPDLVIAGVQKGGTTPFFRFLGAHPQVMPGLVKEAHYFDRHYARGSAWYHAHFPLQAARWVRGLRAGAPVRVMDATPGYLFHPHAPARIGRDLPDARFVILLRNPVDRAYSHYQMMRARDYETLSFADAVEAESERLAGEWEKVKVDPHYLSHPIRLFAYLARGQYADQLERWFRHVPRDQTLVLRSEDARENPATAYRALTDFLGIEAFEPPSFAPPNARRYEPLDPDVRAQVSARFADSNRRLAALLGRDFGWD